MKLFVLSYRAYQPREQHVTDDENRTTKKGCLVGVLKCHFGVALVGDMVYFI